MNKEQLMELAVEHGFEHFATEDAEWLECQLEQLVDLVNYLFETIALEFLNRFSDIAPGDKDIQKYLERTRVQREMYANIVRGMKVKV